MGTDEAEEVEILPNITTAKVHRFICTELMKLVDQISFILPKIEAARPGCSSGIQALCHLSRVNESSKSFLISCCESSKLYLAFRGDVLVSRCERWRNLMEQSLTLIQTMVPVLLSAKISHVLDVVRTVTFTLDSYEEEAGNALRELIYHNASHPDLGVKYEVEALQIAASRLRINSPKALLVEKRSIKKMLNKVSNSELKKRELLMYLFRILTKHGNFMVGEMVMMVSPRPKTPTTPSTAQYFSERYDSSKTEIQQSYCEDLSPKSQMTTESLPQELTCPMSSRIMFDPVVIASGQTFERMWIEKWFSEGNLTCPKTNVKLSNLSWTPNTAIKDLISKWCWAHDVTVPDPSIGSDEDVSSASFVSHASSFKSLHLPNDMSSVSMDSFGSYRSESEVSHEKVSNLRRSILSRTNCDSPTSPSGTMAPEGIIERLSKLPFYSWESQIQLIEEAETDLKSHDVSLRNISSSSFVETVNRVVKDACDFHDLQAQKAASQLLLTFVREKRNEISMLSEDDYSALTDLCEDVYHVLTAMFNSNSTVEILDFMEVLSGHKHCRSRLVASSALSAIVSLLDSSEGECPGLAVRILCNVCLDDENHSHMVALEFIPKLSSLLSNNSLAKFAIFIMKTLCYLEKVQNSIVETAGCITGIAELLESGSLEDQENAVYILFTLCSQHVHYVHKVMNEEIIPALFNISVNGNNKGKTYATELLCLLRDTVFVDKREHHDEPKQAAYQTVGHSNELIAHKSGSPTFKAENPSTKLTGFFGKTFTKLSKANFMSAKRNK